MKKNESIIFKKYVFFKDILTSAVVMCDEASCRIIDGNRIFDSAADDSPFYWELKNDDELQTVIEDLKNNYISNGYEFTLCETVDCAFDYSLKELQKLAKSTKRKKTK